MDKKILICELCSQIGGFCGQCDGSHWIWMNSPAPRPAVTHILVIVPGKGPMQEIPIGEYNLRQRG